MLTNKHFIIALIVTPILAILAYFATDYAISEHPHQATRGSSYPLAAKSNCRYASGQCSFKNGDIAIELSTHAADSDTVEFLLDSAHSLQGVKIALASSNEQIPQAMQATNNNKTQWRITVPGRDTKNAQLLLAISINDVVYYGETEATFVNYQPGFSPVSLH